MSDTPISITETYRLGTAGVDRSIWVEAQLKVTVLFVPADGVKSMVAVIDRRLSASDITVAQRIGCEPERRLALCHTEAQAMHLFVKESTVWKKGALRLVTEKLGDSFEAAAE